MGRTRIRGRLHYEPLVSHENVPVAPDLNLAESLGASGRVPQHDVPSMMKNEQALKVAFNLGKRVAEMAKILKAGRLALKNELPEEYFPPKTRF